MLPRRKRLTRRTFPAVTASRATSPHFSIAVSPALTGHGGCAAVVSKKVARLSVGRHLLKRRMLAVMRPWCDETLALVAYARTGSAALPFSEISAELSSLLTRALPR